MSFPVDSPSGSGTEQFELDPVFLHSRREAVAIFLLWFFGVAIGPWLQHHIPGVDQIVQVIEEQDIDAGAYFYTEIEGSYAGGNYLRQAVKMGAPDQFGLTFPFLSGVFICLLLLFLGWKYLPD